MALNPKLFTLVAGVGGGCGVVPFLFGQNNSSGLTETQAAQNSVTETSGTAVSDPVPETPADPERLEQKAQETDETQSTVVPKVETGNCTVLANPQDIVDMLYDHFFELEMDYIFFSCQDTGDKIMPTDWNGAFPRDLVVDEQKMRTGNKFDLMTETTESDSENYKTVLNSDKLKGSSVLGTWKKPLEIKEEKIVAPITISEDSKKIYLIFKDVF